MTRIARIVAISILSSAAPAWAIGGAGNNDGDHFNPVTSFSAPPSPALAGGNLDRTAAVAHIRAYQSGWEDAARKTANGRQAFEIPSFLATAGSLVAAAVGAKKWVPIAGGGFALGAQAGNAYFSPKAKAELYLSALSAIECVLTKARTAATVPDVAGALSADQFEFESLVGGVKRLDLALREKLLNTGDPSKAKSLLSSFQQSVKTADDAGTNVNNLTQKRDFLVTKSQLMQEERLIGLSNKAPANFMSDRLNNIGNRIISAGDAISEAAAVKARADFDKDVHACTLDVK